MPIRAIRAASFAALAAAALALAGCASDPVPDVVYYQLPPVSAAPRAAPAFTIPIEVQSFRADGVYNEQPILYAAESEASLRGYHYQLWGDPPSRLLQRRLIATLRGAQLAPMVADRLPPAVDALHVSGLIRHFERVKDGDGWRIRVGFEVRVERSAIEPPLLLTEYAVDERVAETGMAASIAAFGRAVDQCFARLLVDLERIKT